MIFRIFLLYIFKMYLDVVFLDLRFLCEINEFLIHI